MRTLIEKITIKDTTRAMIMVEVPRFFPETVLNSGALRLPPKNPPGEKIFLLDIGRKIPVGLAR